MVYSWTDKYNKLYVSGGLSFFAPNHEGHDVSYAIMLEYQTVLITYLLCIE